jgi:hypothetical protein
LANWCLNPKEVNTMQRSISVLIITTICIVTDSVAQPHPINIGNRVELFVDRHLIDSMDGTELRLHEPRGMESVVQFDKPWEGRYSGYSTVLKDGFTYRMYYRGLPTAGKDGSNTETTCYAESADGIRWTKPELGLFEWEGSKANNIILAGHAPLSHNFSPFLDTNPACPPEERLKAVAGTEKSGLIAFVSGDGVRWKKIQEEPVFTEGVFDSQNVAFWSELEQRYVCYFRVWSDGGYKGFRSVAKTTSKDFIHWTKPVEMTYGDTPREHLYTNQTHPYYRNPHVYIAIAARFMPGRRVVSAEIFQEIGGEASYSGDSSDTVLMTSRGGTAYDRTFMEGFVRPGLGMNNWTSRTNYPALGVVHIDNERMSFYVNRNYGQTSAYLQRMEMRVDGFSSVHAPYQGGTMTTKPFRFDGNKLHLNYATSAAGSIWVELQQENGRPIPGFGLDDCDEILGDQIARVVTWDGKSDVSGLNRAVIRMRVRMKDVDLYSIRFSQPSLTRNRVNVRK